MTLLRLNLKLLLLSTAILAVQAFSTPSPAKNNFVSSFLNDLFGNGKTNANNASLEEREKLKNELISLCNDQSIDNRTKRENVEDLISKLRELSPIQQTATSPLLQKEWLLLWTTEKEINFFIDWNISDQITQTLEDYQVLTNTIPFQKGGSFGVKGKLSIPSKSKDIESNNNDDQVLRTEFEFETATLDLGKWGTYSFPPVGKGWFDTVYLDESFRVDLNSRDDILICRSASLP